MSTNALVPNGQARDLSPRDARVAELEAYADGIAYPAETSLGHQPPAPNGDFQRRRAPSNWREPVFFAALIAIVVLLAVIATAVVVGQASNSGSDETVKALTGLVEALVEERQESAERKEERAEAAKPIKLSAWQIQLIFGLVVALCVIGLGYAFAGRGGGALAALAVVLVFGSVTLG